MGQARSGSQIVHVACQRNGESGEQVAGGFGFAVLDHGQHLSGDPALFGEFLQCQSAMSKWGQARICKGL